MKVLVAVKRVVDYNIKVRPKADGSDVEIANAKMSMNPFDEIAVEEAVRMKEASYATEVVAVSLGETACQDIVRTALAMGVDRGLLVETDERLEPLTVAKLLVAIVEREKFDLVILGKQAIDDDSNQTGQMLAALLGWPQATFASQVLVDGDRVQVTRETDTGSQTLSFQPPGVVTSDLRLNEPRYVKLPNIMKAKKKPLDKITPAELGVDISARLEILSVAEPVQRSGGIKVSDAKELVEKLRNEARVI